MLSTSTMAGLVTPRWRVKGRLKQCQTVLRFSHWHIVKNSTYCPWEGLWGVGGGRCSIICQEVAGGACHKFLKIPMAQKCKMYIFLCQIHCCWLPNATVSTVRWSEWIHCKLCNITMASWFPCSDPINTLSQYFVDSIISLNGTCVYLSSIFQKHSTFCRK